MEDGATEASSDD